MAALTRAVAPGPSWAAVNTARKGALDEVETGGGYRSTYTGRNGSAMMANAERQIDGAMMRVVVEMLKDPAIVRYLTE